MKKYLIRLFNIILLFSLIISNTVYVNASSGEVNVYASTEKEFYQYINEFTKGEYKRLQIYIPKDKFKVDEYTYEDENGYIESTNSIATMVAPNGDIDGNYYEYKSRYSFIAKYTLHYYYNDSQGKAKQTEAKANTIIKKIINNNMSSQQKVTAIAKYLEKNAIYATKEYKKVINAASKNNNVIPNKIFAKYKDIYGAYGALINGRCVCAGYSRAFNLLARKAGIPSIMVIKGDHGWNLYKVDKKYYEIDITAKETKGRLLKKPTFNEKKIYKDLFKYIVTGTKKIKMTPYTPPNYDDDDDGEDYDD